MKDAMKRQVPVRFLFLFLLDRPRALSIGLMLTLLPVGAMALIGWLVASMDGTGPDFDAILARGVPVRAEVVAREEVSQITIHHKHPVRITYEYEAGGRLRRDMVQTMDEAGYHLRHGERLEALFWDEDSILPSFSPVTFPRRDIFIVDAIFLVLGLPFLLFASHGALIKWNLYRQGRRLHGEVDSMAPALSIPFTAPRILVAYTASTKEGEAIKGGCVVVSKGWGPKPRGSRIEVLESPCRRYSCAVEAAILKRCRDIR